MSLLKRKLLLTVLAASLLLTTACQNADKPGSAATPTGTVSDTPTPSAGIAIDENALQLQYDASQKEQEIDGFGAGFTWYSNYAVDAHNSDEIMDLLFKDAGLSILRFKNDYDYDSFEASAATNLAFYEAAKARAEERGEDVTILYTSWSPAAYLKSSGKVDGEGTLRRNQNGEYDYEGFAQWWLEGVQAYREKGIPVDVISIQNECDFIASYESCEFDQTETSKNACYADAFLATYRLLRDTLGDEIPLMIGPETMTVSSIDLRMYVQKIIEEEPESLYALAHHLYLGGTSTDDPVYCDYDSFLFNFMDNKEFIQKNNCKAWQTEFYRGTSLQTANVINNSLTYENVSAYIYWGGIWEAQKTDTIYDSNLIIVGKGIPNWPSEDGYLVCGDYYALRHFSEYIRPGYSRITASIKNDGNIRLSMYASPDQSRMVLVVINNGTEEETLQLPLEGYNVTGTKVIQSVFSENYTADMLYQDKGSLSDQNKVTLPAESVTTIVIDGSAK